MCWYKP
jgi:ribonuclease HI